MSEKTATKRDYEQGARQSRAFDAFHDIYESLLFEGVPDDAIKDAMYHMVEFHIDTKTQALK